MLCNNDDNVRLEVSDLFTINGSDEIVSSRCSMHNQAQRGQKLPLQTKLKITERWAVNRRYDVDSFLSRASKRTRMDARSRAPDDVHGT